MAPIQLWSEKPRKNKLIRQIFIPVEPHERSCGAYFIPLNVISPILNDYRQT